MGDSSPSLAWAWLNWPARAHLEVTKAQRKAGLASWAEPGGAALDAAGDLISDRQEKNCVEVAQSKCSSGVTDTVVVVWKQPGYVDLGLETSFIAPAFTPQPHTRPEKQAG